MHDPDWVAYLLAFANEDRRFTVDTAADGENSVGYGFAGVEWDRGVETESCDVLAKFLWRMD